MSVEQERTPGLLVVMSGPGAVGKDTLINRLRERDPNLRYSISYTTRPLRPNERDGVHYTFVTESEFRLLIEEGEFIEHAVVNGFLYGTSGARVEGIQRQGYDAILNIEVQGAENVRRKRPDGVFIFISPPSMEELLRRRRDRGTETEEVIQQRQKLAEWEMSFADRYDQVVVNEDLDQAAGDILGILKNERRRRGRWRGRGRTPR